MQHTVTIENRLTLAQAGRLVGKSPSAVFRWIRDGSAGERLEAAYFGSSLFTSEAALNDFGARVARAKLAHREAATADHAAMPWKPASNHIKRTHPGRRRIKAPGVW